MTSISRSVILANQLNLKCGTRPGNAAFVPPPPENCPNAWVKLSGSCTTGRKRNRLYKYTRYIEIMNYGTGLPDEYSQNNL